MKESWEVDPSDGPGNWVDVDGYPATPEEALRLHEEFARTGGVHGWLWKLDRADD